MSIDVSIDDQLEGALATYMPALRHCGRPPDDFADEGTVIEDRPRAAVFGLVK